jgi:hypothetical protein
VSWPQALAGDELGQIIEQHGVKISRVIHAVNVQDLVHLPIDWRRGESLTYTAPTLMRNPESRNGKRWSAMRLVLLSLLLTGCAIASRTEKPVTDFKQVAGSWTAWVPGASGTIFRGDLLIRSDGGYRLAWERAYFTESRLALEGGSLRFGHSGSWTGRVVLVEERGAEYLRFVLDTGALWAEFQRAP